MTCTYKDLEIHGKSLQTYKVDEDFEAGELVEDTGLEEIESVDCNNCGEWFDSLKDAQEHIEDQAEKGK